MAGLEKTSKEGDGRMHVQRPRLADVSKAAGVATNTASMILNDRPNCWASEATRKRVLDEASRLGYRPNRIALAVKKRRFDTLGLIVPDLNNPFFMNLACQIEEAAEARGCDLIIEHSRVDLLREINCLESILDRQVDGIIACLIDPPAHESLLRSHLKYGVPMVVAGQRGPRPLPVDLITVDFEGGLEQALTYLRQSGHSRVGFIRALAENQADNGRQEIFLNVARRLGFDEKDLHVEPSDHSMTGAKAAFHRLIEGRKDHMPTAVIGLNDLCGLGALRGAHDAGLQVPRDLSVIGVDDIALCKLLNPSLTSIAQPIHEIGQYAVDMLFDRIEGKTKDGPREKVLSSNLVLRESTGPASV
jgi:LacI family transcriptional regulator